MNEEQIEALKSIISGKSTVLWRSPDGSFWEVYGVSNKPAFEGDAYPEPSITFSDQRGWAALDNCEPEHFVVATHIFE